MLISLRLVLNRISINKTRLETRTSLHLGVDRSRLRFRRMTLPGTHEHNSLTTAVTRKAVNFLAAWIIRVCKEHRKQKRATNNKSELEHLIYLFTVVGQKF